MRPLSLRARIMIWHVASILVVLSACGLLVYRATKSRLLDQIDHELTVEYDEVADVIGRSRDRSQLLYRLKRDFTEHEGLEFQVIELGGGPIFRSRLFASNAPDPPRDLPKTPVIRESAVAGLGRFRIREGVVRFNGADYVVQDAHTLKAHDHAMAQLLVALLATGLPATAVSVAVGFLVAKRSLEPIDRITLEAAEINANDLDRRIRVPESEDEPARLARTLNGLFERLQKAFDDNRRFTSDAAHELRTPLAVLRSAVEVALKSRRTPEEYERVLGDLREETIRLSRLADELLFLSRRDARCDPGVRVPTRLDELVAETVSAFESAADQQGDSLVCETPEPIMIQADPDQIRRVMINLLNNAIRHTRNDEIRIRVARTSGRGGASITIIDRGEGIAPEQLPKVFDRFFRGDRARRSDTGGSGLGLSISKAIAEAHGGSITIKSDLGRGTTVTVNLPALDPEPAPRPVLKDHALSG